MAGRTLPLDEIDLAIGVNEQTLSYADLELERSSPLEETLSSRCGLMVSIIGSKVYLIYQTTKEFLLDEVGTKTSAERIWQQSLNSAALLWCSTMANGSLFFLTKILDPGFPHHDCSTPGRRFSVLKSANCCLYAKV